MLEMAVVGREDGKKVCHCEAKGRGKLLADEGFRFTSQRVFIKIRKILRKKQAGFYVPEGRKERNREGGNRSNEEKGIYMRAGGGAAGAVCCFWGQAEAEADGKGA